MFDDNCNASGSPDRRWVIRGPFTVKLGITLTLIPIEARDCRPTCPFIGSAALTPCSPVARPSPAAHRMNADPFNISPRPTDKQRFAFPNVKRGFHLVSF